MVKVNDELLETAAAIAGPGCRWLDGVEIANICKELLAARKIISLASQVDQDFNSHGALELMKLLEEFNKNWGESK